MSTRPDNDPLRELRDIRLVIHEETKSMTPAERAAAARREVEAYLAKHPLDIRRLESPARLPDPR